MSRKPARKGPTPAVTASCQPADLDPRMIVVDPGFAATLTTRHVRSFEVALGRSDVEVDEFTRELPNVGDEALAHLDAAGLAMPGSPVRPGTILVGKTTPHARPPSSPEEKLLLAIFGEEPGAVRDSSLRAPVRCFGVVTSARSDGERAEVSVAWERPLEVGDVLIVDGAQLVVAEIRPLSADLARAGGGTEVSVIKGAMARDALMARSIGPYESPYEQPTRDEDAGGGQVVSAGAIAALAGAAPWAAWELLTIKSDAVFARARLFESLVKRERPDVIPRTAAPALLPDPPAPPTNADIFSFFDREPAAAPEHAAALQPEVVTLLALHLLALGLHVDLRLHEVGAVFLSPEQIREASRGQVRSAGDLGSQRIFGPIADYVCECGKHKRMRDRGLVCEECGVEVIQSRARRERCGHIELAAPCVYPPLSGASRHRDAARGEPLSGHAPALTTLLVPPPALRGPTLDAAYARVLAADEDALQPAVDQLFAELADLVDTILHPRMYTKAVDYSGAAHLVVDASLNPGECRVPRELLLELFRPQAFGLLEAHGYTTTIKGAKRMVEQAQPEALTAIAEASEGYPVLLIAGAAVVARRVLAWDAPTIAVDAATADVLKARVVMLHVPVSHEAAITIAGLDDAPRAPTPSYGWLARARRDGRLVEAAIRAALSGERDPVADPVLRVALGRAPDPVDDSALEAWQIAEDARQRDIHDRLVVRFVADESSALDPLDRLVDELELSVRTANGLQNLGIVTLRDLCARSEGELVRGQLSRKSIIELKQILDELGLSLGMPDE